MRFIVEKDLYGNIYAYYETEKRFAQNQRFRKNSYKFKKEDFDQCDLGLQSAGYHVVKVHTGGKKKKRVRSRGAKK